MRTQARSFLPICRWARAVCQGLRCRPLLTKNVIPPSAVHSRDCLSSSLYPDRKRPSLIISPDQGRGRMPERAILQGDLSRIQLPDVLSFVAMIRESGKLVVRRMELERTIHWNSGEIVFASSSSPEHSLGQFLL